MTVEKVPPSGRENAARSMIAIVDKKGTLRAWLSAACEELQIEFRLLPTPAALSRALQQHAPCAVVYGDLGHEALNITRILRVLVSYDRVMPVLLVTANDPDTLHRVGAALRLSPMPKAEHLSGRVRAETVFEFLWSVVPATGTPFLLEP